MKLSITGVANRASRKALLRCTSKMVWLKESFHEIPLSITDHWCIMATLVEDDINYLREIKNKDQIFQVEVGYGTDFTYADADDQLLSQAIFGAIERVLRAYPYYNQSDVRMINDWIRDSAERIKQK